MPQRRFYTWARTCGHSGMDMGLFCPISRSLRIEFACIDKENMLFVWWVEMGCFSLFCFQVLLGIFSFKCYDDEHFVRGIAGSAKFWAVIIFVGSNTDIDLFVLLSCLIESF